jgi:di/tripeptidase
MKPLEEEAKAFELAAQSALDQENNRWHDHGKLQMQIDRLGFRPTGETSASSRLVTTVSAVNRAMDLPAIKLSAASTDSNLPMSLGIPAITIAGGGAGTGPHTTAEAMDVTGAWIGMQRDLLLVVSLVD